MDIEELRKALGTDDGKTLIAELMAPVLKKNKELLTENSTLKKKKAPEDIDEIMRKALERDELERKRLEAKGEYEKSLKAVQEQHATILKAKDDELTKLNGSLRQHLVGDGLTRELLAVGVIPETVPILVDFMNKDVQVLDGKPKAGEKDLATFVKDWSKSDSAKHFLSNKAGGGGGSGNSGGAGDEDEKHFKPETVNLTKQVQLKQSDPEKYKRLKEKYPDKRQAPVMF